MEILVPNSVRNSQATTRQMRQTEFHSKIFKSVVLPTSWYPETKKIKLRPYCSFRELLNLTVFWSKLRSPMSRTGPEEEDGSRAVQLGRLQCYTCKIIFSGYFYRGFSHIANRRRGTAVPRLSPIFNSATVASRPESESVMKCNGSGSPKRVYPNFRKGVPRNSSRSPEERSTQFPGMWSTLGPPPTRRRRSVILR